MRKRWLALALSGLILPQLAWSQAPEAALNLPRVSGTLDAKHTMGFISLEHLDDLSAEGLKRLGELPASLREDIPEQIFSPEGRLELLGFEPSTQAGWRAAGIDPIAGITVLFDARIARRGEPQPIFLLKVTDQAAALKVLQRIPGGAQLEPVEGASAATLTLDGERFFIGELGHYTALTPIPNQDEASARARFEAFLSAEGEPLLARVEYKEAMRGQVQSARLFVYGALGGLIEKFRLGKEFDPELFEQIPNFEHYAARFPALGGVFGLEDATTQLVAWGEGLKLLDDLFLVKAPLDLARFVPASGWAAARLSLNAPRLFDSIAALAPPTEQAEVAQEMTKAQAELAKELDITWAQISAALPGHGLIAVDLSTLMAIQMQGPAGLNFLGVATVGDPMWADTLLVKLAAKFEAEAGHKPLRIETQGGQGYSFSADGFTVVLIRAGQTLFAAPNAEAINAALERGKVAVAADAPNAILDALASPFALYVDAGLIIQMVEMFSGMVPEAQEGMTYLKGQPWWKRFSDKPIIAFKIGLERGLRFEGPAMLVGGGAMGLFGAGVGYFMMMPAKMEAPAEIYEVPAKQDMMEIAAPEPIEALEAVEAPVIEQPEPVIEQPEPVIEQPEPVIEQPEPVVEQPKLTLDKAPITHKKP
ncbi:hypothetical protein KKB55_02485, partial [Myxococcota bacterium]|nr:hypothetical protein [Myxococcota bacterium]